MARSDNHRVIYRSFCRLLDQVLTVEKPLVSFNAILDKLYAQCVYLVRATYEDEDVDITLKLKKDKPRDKHSTFNDLVKFASEKAFQFAIEMANGIRYNENPKIYLQNVVETYRQFTLRMELLKRVFDFIDHKSNFVDCSNKSSIIDYSKRCFLQHYLSLNGTTFSAFLEVMLEKYRNDEDSTALTVFRELVPTLCRLKLSIVPQGHITMASYYSANFGNHIKNNLKMAYNKFYVENTQLRMHRELLLASVISDDIAEETRLAFLRHTIANDSILEKLLPIYVFGTDELWATQTLEKVYFCYRTFGKVANFQKKLEFAILNEFEQINHGKDIDILGFGSAFHHFGKNLSKFMGIKDSKKVIDTTKDAIRASHGSNIGFIELFVKQVDIRLKKNYQLLSDNAIAGEIEKSILNLDNVSVVLDIIELKGKLLEIYLDKYLLRRIILMNSDFLKHFDDSRKLCEERLFCNFLMNKCGQRMERLSKVIDDVQDSNRLMEISKKSCTTPELVPLIFERKCVPQSLQQFHIDIPRLPTQLEELWATFLKDFTEHERAAKYKTLHPQYQLHVLEISTPFTFEEKPLILEVNLLQYCILQLFDDKDTLSLDNIKHQLNMKKSESLLRALSSFTQVKLLLQQQSIYKFNRQFRPDRKKVKKGKLRVTYR